jgi:hypothetical protein
VRIAARAQPSNAARTLVRHDPSRPDSLEGCCTHCVVAFAGTIGLFLAAANPAIMNTAA